MPGVPVSALHKEYSRFALDAHSLRSRILGNGRHLTGSLARLPGRRMAHQRDSRHLSRLRFNAKAGQGQLPIASHHCSRRALVCLAVLSPVRKSSSSAELAVVPQWQGSKLHQASHSAVRLLAMMGPDPNKGLTYDQVLILRTHHDATWQPRAAIAPHPYTAQLQRACQTRSRSVCCSLSSVYS